MAKLDLTGTTPSKRRLIYKILVIYRDVGFTETWKKRGGMKSILKKTEDELTKHLAKLQDSDPEKVLMFKSNKELSKPAPKSFAPREREEIVVLGANGKPILGYCYNHPKKAAVAAEGPPNGQKGVWIKFCRDCWNHHKYTKLGLRPAPRFKTFIHIRPVQQPSTIVRMVKQLAMFGLIFLLGCAPQPYQQWAKENRIMASMSLEDRLEWMKKQEPEGILPYPTPGAVAFPPNFTEGFYYQNSIFLQSTYGHRIR